RTPGGVHDPALRLSASDEFTPRAVDEDRHTDVPGRALLRRDSGETLHEVPVVRVVLSLAGPGSGCEPLAADAGRPTQGIDHDPGVVGHRGDARTFEEVARLRARVLLEGGIGLEVILLGRLRDAGLVQVEYPE